MDAQPSNLSSYQALYEVAEQQAGYFTAVQAKALGFSERQLSYYTHTHRFDRVRKGIYRLIHFPSSPHEDLFVAWLEAGRNSVVSHESALALYELSDVLPSQTHLIIPRTASRRHKGLRLHTNQLREEEITRFSGLPVTTVSRTVADVAATGLAEELVIQAAHQAIQRGLATKASLQAAADRRGGRARRLIRQALEGEQREIPQRRSFSQSAGRPAEEPGPEPGAATRAPAQDGGV